MGKNIAQPKYEVFGYINSFRKLDDDKPTWFAQVSLIVDNSKDEKKPFVFQYASLPVYGTARHILQLHNRVEGAEEYYCGGEKGKPRLMRFTILGYRAVSTDKNKSGFEMKGRIISIDDPYEQEFEIDYPPYPTS